MTILSVALGSILTAPIQKFEISAIPTISIHDELRNKDLKIRVTYPKPNGQYPVIVFSHGLGGNKDLMQPLIQPWAKSGYVVIQPSHADSEVWKEPGALRKSLPQLAGNPLDRPKDISLILDTLGKIESDFPELKGKIDQKKIAMAGHSYGAWTTMAIGGLKSKSKLGSNLSLEDKRPICLLPISPQGIEDDTRGDVFSEISRPTFSISGTEDVSRFEISKSAEARRKLFENQPKGDKFLLWIDGADHSFGGISGARGDKTKSDAIFDLVVRATTEFFNAFLKQDPAAKQKFSNESFKTQDSPKYEFLSK